MDGDREPEDIPVIDLESATVESLMADHGIPKEMAQSLLAYQGDLFDLIFVDEEGNEHHEGEADD